MKQRLTKSFLLLSVVVCAVFALEPNFVRSKTLEIGRDAATGTLQDMITTEYADGLGRQIQTKLSLIGGGDRTVCTYYDAAGRQEYVTKTFIDLNTGTEGKYLPGDLSDPAVFDQLKDQYTSLARIDNPTAPVEMRPYSQTEYWNYPIGQPRKVIGPGDAYVDEYARAWTIGVALNAATATNPYPYIVTYENGGGNSVDGNRRLDHCGYSGGNGAVVYR